MSGLFNDSTATKMKNIKKIFLWAAVCILIGELVMGVFLILAESFNLVIGKIMGTFALCGGVLFVEVMNFTSMEKDDKLVQGFALTSLITNLVWLLLAVMLIWEMIPFVAQSHGSYIGSYYGGLSFWAKMMFSSLNIAISSLLISIVWAIEETVKPVKPLKITAIICELYCGIYGVIVTLGALDTLSNAKWVTLAGLAGFAFIIIAIAALMISKSGKKKQEVSTGATAQVATTGQVKAVKSEAEIRAEIEEKVRREMIEKEVRAKVEAEMKQGATVGAEPMTQVGTTEPNGVTESTEVTNQTGNQPE